MIYETFCSGSRILNRLTGGKTNQTLCARIARRFGHDCWFCRFVGAVTLDRDHCWKALIVDLRLQKRS